MDKIQETSFPPMRNIRVYYTEISSQQNIAQLQQLTSLTFDGDLADKAAARLLHEAGYITRFDGWNIITKEGVAYLKRFGFINP
jgi:hypothetical protein